jgi:hypothetical protein
MKLLRIIDFNTDTVRIGTALREHIIDIETNLEDEVIFSDMNEGLIIRKLDDGRIALGAQD